MTEPSNTEVDYYDGPAVPSQGVSAVPTPGAVSDLKPESEQTDNNESPKDGPQDTNDVLNEKKDSDVAKVK